MWGESIVFLLALVVGQQRRRAKNVKVVGSTLSQRTHQQNNILMSVTFNIYSLLLQQCVCVCVCTELEMNFPACMVYLFFF